MPKRTSTKIPKDAMIVRTYEEFFREVEAFEDGLASSREAVGKGRVRLHAVGGGVSNGGK